MSACRIIVSAQLQELLMMLYAAVMFDGQGIPSGRSGKEWIGGMIMRR
jgi:hypothetical protein